jgi:hypothetical protein
MAWGEREASDRSAKWSAAMVVATFAALLFCLRQRFSPLQSA